MKRSGWLLLALPSAALAHSPLAAQVQWPVLLSALLVAAAWLLYPLGLRRQASRHRASLRAQLLFHATSALLAATLFGPLDTWAERSAAAHMTQHMLLMLVIAPLGVLANPLPAWRAALRPAANRCWWLLLWPLRYPLLVTLLHAAAIWGWHAPAPYLLALREPLWHVVEHACFLFSAWWFWWLVLRAPRSRAGSRILALTTTMVHTGLLGALLTFGTRLLYGDARSLPDQQLAGLIMWVPGGFVYLLALAWCLRRWLRAEPAFAWRSPAGDNSPPARIRHRHRSLNHARRNPR